MRRQLILTALVTLPLLLAEVTLGETAQEAAARQEAEDNYRRINARVDDLFAAIESLQKRFNAMQDELRKLNEEVARTTDRAKDTSSHEELRRLAKALEEVDKKRVTDRDKLLDAFADLEKGIAALGSSSKPSSTPKSSKGGSAPAPRAQSPKNGGTAPPATPEKGYEYVVQEGDTLSRIVTALNKQGMKQTSKQISDANPSINWNRLQIGQKVFIPAP